LNSDKYHIKLLLNNNLRWL